MKILDVKQGTDEWLSVRLGIPTASQFHRLITPKTHKPSSQAVGYMYELIAERILGQPLDSASSGFMQRGSEMEAEAVKWYEAMTGNETQTVGFMMSDDGTYGGSPDRLIGDHSGLEIKCPSPAKHIASMIALSPDYEMQCQGYMLISGRKSWDFVSYNPIIPPALYHLERDDELCDALLDAIETLFVDMRDTLYQLHKRYGITKEDNQWATKHAG